jgi:hypothetical protein
MANNDLAEMDAGRMDPTGRGLTAAGKTCGIIGLVMACLALLSVPLIIALATGVP